MAWLGTWANRIEIDIDYTNKIGASVTWLPIAIIIESGLAGVGDKDVSCIFDELTSDANRFKIAVTKADGTTQLYAEIEQWDDANENAVLHVSRDGWTIDADMSIFLYYDSAQDDNSTYIADITARAEVWDGNFKMVHHMVDDNGNVDDSTSNNNDGTKKGVGEPAEVAAQMYKGQEFDGADDYIETPFNPKNEINTSDFTVSLWLKHAGGTDNRVHIGEASAAPRFYFGLRQTNGDLNKLNSGLASSGGVVGATALSQGQWYLVTWVFDYSVGKLEAYLDDANSDGSITHADFKEDLRDAGLQIGDINTSHQGIIDEVRISNIMRSTAWIKADYNSGNDSLLTYGDEEVVAVVAFYQKYNPLGINMYSAGQVR